MVRMTLATQDIIQMTLKKTKGPYSVIVFCCTAFFVYKLYNAAL